MDKTIDMHYLTDENGNVYYFDLVKREFFPYNAKTKNLPIYAKLNYPVIKKMRDKCEQYILDGTYPSLNVLCKKYNMDDFFLKRLLYDKTKSAYNDFGRFPFDTMVKLSYMFDVPLIELAEYDLWVEVQKRKSMAQQEEEELMRKQYEIGKEWENKVILYYADKGYFTYKMPTMNDGTVFDIIAVHKGAALMIECKHIEDEKLDYKKCGIYKKRDELDHFVDTTGNNVYIYVNSDKTGTWWTTWVKAKPIFEEKGYLTKEDCFKCKID